MKKYIFSLCALAFLSAESYSAAGPVIRTGLIPKKDFIENLIGMSEKDFRRLAGWDERQGVLTRMQNIQQWIQAYPPRAAVFEGQFTFNTVRDLDQKIPRQMRPLGRPRFRVLVHDPAQPHLTDIAALQADPANYGAVFQIASTPFGPLEGGISKTSSYVENMVDHAVQGEDASISCAGATFWRKYFMPTWRRAQGKNGYFNLFHNIRTVPFKKSSTGKPYIDVNDVKKYRYDHADIKKIGIGIHADVVVTSGYAGRNNIWATPVQRINQNNNANNLIAQPVQRVTQIFTTAYNTKYARAHRVKGSWNDFAKVALNASYEATLKAAYVLGKPRVYLTLMGGGSFRNDMAWIAKAIERMAPFIEQAGLDVTLIYRPDKPRNIAVRSSRGDGKFVKKMAEMASHINRRRLPADIDQRIKNYVSGAYRKNPAVSRHARRLNAVLAR